MASPQHLLSVLQGVAAPALAYYSYRAVTSSAIPADLRPGKALTAWSWTSVVVLAICALAFFALRLF